MNVPKPVKNNPTKKKIHLLEGSNQSELAKDSSDTTPRYLNG